MRLNKRIERRSNCLGMHFNERPCPCVDVAKVEEKKISAIVIKQTNTWRQIQLNWIKRDRLLVAPLSYEWQNLHIEFQIKNRLALRQLNFAPRPGAICSICCGLRAMCVCVRLPCYLFFVSSATGSLLIGVFLRWVLKDGLRDCQHCLFLCATRHHSRPWASGHCCCCWLFYLYLRARPTILDCCVNFALARCCIAVELWAYSDFLGSFTPAHLHWG
jgi:hypothetical protein